MEVGKALYRIHSFMYPVIQTRTHFRSAPRQQNNLRQATQSVGVVFFHFIIFRLQKYTFFQ